MVMVNTKRSLVDTTTRFTPITNNTHSTEQDSNVHPKTRSCTTYSVVALFVALRLHRVDI